MEKISSMDSVLLFQELTNNAWPAKRYSFYNGWILRFSHGIFDRANSVLPLKYFGLNIKQDIRKIEDIYSNQGLKPVFQVPEYTDPKDLDIILNNLDYSIKSPTMVLYKHLEQSTNNNSNYTFSYTKDYVDSKWLDIFHEFSGQPATRQKQMKAVISRINVPKRVFFYINEEEEAVGLTLGVFEREYLGIYSLLVSPKMKRKSIGYTFMQFIENYCLKNGTNNIYLQVEKENTPAVNLYKKLGFRKLYSYHYRIKSD